MIRIETDPLAAKAAFLRRAPLEETELTPAGQARVRELFGEDLTASQVVDRIIADVRQQGDAALRDYTLRLDGASPESLVATRAEIDAAHAEVSPRLVEALRAAAERVRRFHEKQRRPSWIDYSEGALGQIVRPLERVGVYAPGGTAAYPSTVLMSVIPARVAGVEEIVVATPPGKDGRLPAITTVAADVAGVDRIYKMGGTQAIAALAYGTESVPQVDKIVGPGNLFVVLAKRRVYGAVAIDALPGPTETLIIADDSADPGTCAADLLAQAEHDVLASAILLTPSRALAEAVQAEVERQATLLERREIIAESLQRNGRIVLCDSLDQAVDLANAYAPEHLCLIVRDGWAHVGKIRHAGGIFLGEHSFEVLGDYLAGPSHVMPTGRTARFSSPLNVDDFTKIISLIALSPEAGRALSPLAAELAAAEGLGGHAAAAWRRVAPEPAPVPRRGGASS